MLLKPKTVTSQTKKQLPAGLPSYHSPCGEGVGGRLLGGQDSYRSLECLRVGEIPLLPWNNCGQSPRGNLESSSCRTTGHPV